jgi:NADPH:quinone reductase-like Zn-dependent oxidoreductase
MELVRSLGADQVIDYTQEDFVDVVKDFDCVLDPMPYANEEKTMLSSVLKATGSHYIHIASSDPKLKPGDAGTDRLGAAIPEARLSNIISLGFKHFKSWFSHVKFHSVFVSSDQTTLGQVAAAVRSGKVRPVIDREYQLAELAAAHDYVGAGHCHGKVLVHNVHSHPSLDRNSEQL